MQELCVKEGSETLAFFQAEKGRENRFIVLLGGSTGCRAELPPTPNGFTDCLSFSFSFSLSPASYSNCKGTLFSPQSGSGSGLGQHP